jgi:putative acetyltransferase
MMIRKASVKDSNEIQRIYLSSFPEEERDIVANLATELLSEAASPEILSYLAEQDGNAAGHVAFSPVSVASNKNWQGYILAPLAVRPEFQGRKVGSQLVRHGIEELSRKGVNALFVYGDPEYYSRFGFDAEIAQNYIVPYELQYPLGWQAVILNEYDVGPETVEISCVSALSRPDLW